MSCGRSEPKIASMNALEIQTHLQQLLAERVLASFEGLSDVPAYMADLEEEIESARHAYVGAAVTEIASLRAQLSGPQVG
jgi:hypothetical protein